MKYFNTTGPCDPAVHYVVPAVPRLPEARPLIERGLFFVVHAPRQTGKTTTLRALAPALTAEGRLAVPYFSGEAALAAGENYGAAERAVLSAIRQWSAALPRARTRARTRTRARARARARTRFAPAPQGHRISNRRESWALASGAMARSPIPFLPPPFRFCLCPGRSRPTVARRFLRGFR